MLRWKQDTGWSGAGGCPGMQGDLGAGRFAAQNPGNARGGSGFNMEQSTHGLKHVVTTGAP